MTATIGDVPPGKGVGSGFDSVDFYDGQTKLNTNGPVPVSGNQAIYRTSALAIGSHTLKAHYNAMAGAPVASVWSDPYPYTVTGLEANVELRASPTGILQSGTAITLTATVTKQPGGQAITQGTVLFCAGEADTCAGGNIVGSAQLSAQNNGVVTQTVLPGVGIDAYAAVLVQSKGFTQTASNSVFVTVAGQYPSATELSASGSVGNYTVDATVKGIVPRRFKSLTPTGAVDLNDTSNTDAPNYTLKSPTLSSIPRGFALAQPVPVTTGSGLSTTATADFNRDGAPDLVVPDSSDKKVRIYINNGDGTFAKSPSYTTPTALSGNPTSVVAGFFEGEWDETADFAVGLDNGNVITYLGDHSLGFKASTPSPSAAAVSSLVAGDFNNDAKLDLAVVQAANVTMMVGGGDGTFTIPKGGTVNPGTRSYGLSSAADLDGDGKLDLAVAGFYDFQVFVLWGNGDGTVGPTPHKINAAANVTSTAIADFDRDGKLDILAGVLSGSSNSRLQVFQGQGQRQFSAAKANIMLPINTSPMVAAADFDGDGIADIADAYAGTLEVRRGQVQTQDQWVFAAPANQSIANTSAHALAVADFDRNGLPDIASLSHGSALAVALVENIYGFELAAAPGMPLAAGSSAAAVVAGQFQCCQGPGPLTALAVANTDDKTVTIYQINQDGTFTGSVYGSPLHLGDAPYAMAVGDFNNDGANDLVVGNGTNVSFFQSQASAPNLKTPPTNSNAIPTGSTGGSMVASDLNLDGKLDLAVTSTDSRSNSTVTVLIGDGKGGFTPAGNPTGTGKDASAIAEGDFNNDDKPDLAISHYTSENVVVLLGTGTGAFLPNPATLSTPPMARSVVAADFDADGKLDMAVVANCSNCDSRLWVFQGLGDGVTFKKKLDQHVGHMPNNPPALATGDFNGDGYLDFAVLYWQTGELEVWLGDGLWGFTKAAPFVVSWGAAFITAGDFNYDGLADFAAVRMRNNLALYVILSQPTVAATASASGISVVGTGDHQIQAHYKGDLLFRDSTSAQTVPLTAQKLDTTLTVAAVPLGSSQSGQSVTLTATFGIKDNKDAQGHTPASELVTFSVGTLTLGQAPLVLVDQQYVATLPTTELPLGNNITITATYGGDANFNNTSGTLPYTVNPGPGAKVDLKASPTGILHPGDPVKLTATVTDQSAGQAITQGTVLFCSGEADTCAGGNIVGSAQLSAQNNGVVTQTVLPGVGIDAYAAVLVQSKGFTQTASNSVFVTVVGQYPSTTELSASGSVGNYTVDATVKGIVPRRFKSLTPTGAVDLNDTSNTDAPNYTLKSPTLSSIPRGFALAQPVPVTTGSGLSSVATADFNRDGNPDLVVADTSDKKVRVYAGKSDGTLETDPRYTSAALSANPTSVVAGFFKDQLADLPDFVVGLDDGNVVTFLGDWAFAFTPSTLSSSGAAVSSLVAGDFNNNGKLDLAVIQGASVTMMVGGGNGTFTIPTGGTVNPGTRSYGLSSAADLDGDDKLDLAVAGFYNYQVFVLWGKGDGTVDPTPYKINAAANVTSTAIADFDRDGRLDILAGVRSGGGASRLQVFQGLGQRQFSGAKANLMLPYNTSPAVAAADFDGDGIPDIADAYAGTLEVRRGQLQTQDQWVFAAPTSQGIANTGGHALAVADFDGNGLPDIASLSNGSALAVALVEDIYGFEFAAAPGTPLATGTTPVAVVAGQFQCCQGPGPLTALAVANKDDNTVTIYQANQNGTFTGSVYGSPLHLGDAPYAMAVGDFNHDGADDLVVGNGINVSFFQSQASPPNLKTPPTTSTAIPAGSKGTAMVATDINLDGKLDLAVTSTDAQSNSTVTMLIGDGNGGFKPEENPTGTGKDASAIAAGDFNNDAKPDLAISHYTSGNVVVLLGTGTGDFLSDPAKLSTPPNTNSVIAADFDADGNLDMAVGARSGAGLDRLWVFQGLGDGVTFKEKLAQTIGPAWDVRPTLSAGDFDSDGYIDFAVLFDAHYSEGLFEGHYLQVWRGNGLWGFTPATPFAMNGIAIAVGDFNYDGIPDFAAARHDNKLSVILSQPTVAATASASGISVVGTGDHQIQATYKGDILFKDSTSAETLPLTAQKLTLTFTLTPDPQSVGSQLDPVNLTATVSPNGNAQGHTTDGVEIDFYAGNNLLGTRKLSGGTAVYTTQPYDLNSGLNTVKAVYKGSSTANPNFAIPADATNTVNVGSRKP